MTGRPTQAELEAYLRRRLANQSAHPEQRLPQGLLDEVGNKLVAAETGAGVWCRPAEAGELRHSCAWLQLIARYSADLALHLHRLALGRWLLRQLSWGERGAGDSLALLVQGSYGLGRDALPRYLRGRRLGEPDKRLLADCYDPTLQGLPLIAPASWTSLMRPVWRRDALQWQLCEREQLKVQDVGGHAFEELGHYRLGITDAGAESALSATQARDLYGRVLVLEMLGLLAIAAGSLQRGARLAQEYAQGRRQGGQPLDAHAAVQLMLARIAQAGYRAELELDRLQAMSPPPLGAVVACRAGLQRALREAADDIVQLHGGLGYMRNRGAEKVLREQNQLLLMSGTPNELLLFLSAWERAA